MYRLTKLAFRKEQRTVWNIDVTDMCLWVKWMKTAELKNVFTEMHALVWVCVCLCACVCVTVHNWAIDAEILLGPCHSILTQVANMAGDCKNSCMCWLRSEYRILWMCIGTCRKTIRETHSSLCSFIFLQKQSLCWRENDVLFSWITTINCVLLICVPQLDTEFVVCCSNKI